MGLAPLGYMLHKFLRCRGLVLRKRSRYPVPLVYYALKLGGATWYSNLELACYHVAIDTEFQALIERRE
jgi:hypothetical protein